MSGDKHIAMLAFFAAAFLHLLALILVSYMPISKLELPASPSRTRYVVQFQQPIHTPAPTAVPVPPTPVPLAAPDLPMPVQPRPRQPPPAPQPVRTRQQQTPPTDTEVQRPEPRLKPIETPVRPRQPAQPRQPVRVSPRRREPPTIAKPPPPRKAPDHAQQPKRVTARKPSDVKVQKEREPIAPRSPIPRQPAPQAQQTQQQPQPTASPAQDVQHQYLAMISDALQRHKHYPSVARRRGLSGKVVLDFVILSTGQITDIRIIESQSNGHAILHQAALRAVRQASPLPSFPKALEKPSLRVTIPIVYELTER